MSEHRGPAAAPPPRSVRWPPPIPGRPRWAWLLGTRYRGWRLRSLFGLLDGRALAGVTLASLGSGPGFDVAHLARRGSVGAARWLLLEPQSAMWTPTPRLERVARRPLRLDRVQGDAADLPFRSGSLDVVLSLGVLCCMTDAAVPAAVAETYRVLRPGGYLLFGVPRRRAEADEARWRAIGLERVASVRPGRTLFQKPL